MNLPMTIRTQGRYPTRVIRARISKTSNMMRLKVIVTVRALEGSRLFASLTDPL